MTQAAKYGDEDNGFELLIEKESNLLRIKEWGFWTDDHAVAFKEAVAKAIKTFSDGTPEGQKKWNILADIDAYKAQSTSVQEAQKAVMDLGYQNGLSKVAYVIYPNSLTRIQMERLYKEWGVTAVSFHAEEDSALAWLKEE